jgi:hypothetical protein
MNPFDAFDDTMDEDLRELEEDRKKHGPEYGKAKGKGKIIQSEEEWRWQKRKQLYITLIVGYGTTIIFVMLAIMFQNGLWAMLGLLTLFYTPILAYGE